MRGDSSDPNRPLVLVAAPTINEAVVAHELTRHGLAPLLTSPGVTPFELLARSDPAVAIVSANLPHARVLLQSLRRRSIPGMIVGADQELRALEAHIIGVGLVETAAPREIAIAAAVLAEEPRRDRQDPPSGLEPGASHQAQTETAEKGIAPASG